ncbi:MAG: cysteine dioxygenase [Actinobacteria bacterium]|jgi:mannose-6-phosphate isomerase-like protein (cupin superfamily)|nr:MAG: cysteine dioxygenase [Actinomycetota bacterium]
MSLTTDELERFAATLAGTPERWERLVRHAGEERVYEQIWDDPEVNAWVICWSEDQDTGYHDHDESAAAVAVVSGRVREDRLAFGAPPRSQEMGAGETFIVPAVAIHRVLHAGMAPAVTVHAYSPPLRRTGVYRIAPDGELQRESVPSETELGAQRAATPVDGAGAELALR